MKLNNKGWGTLEMILISGALLVALIIAIFFISKLYGSFSLSHQNKIYMDLEEKLTDAARRYVENNNIEIIDSYQINYDLLKEKGYIHNFEDHDGDECTGYTIVSRINNKNYYKSYISCDNYTTGDLTNNN